MAQNHQKQDLKKAFLIYKDTLDVLDLLTDEQAGKLFKAIRDFNNGKQPELELALQVAFLPFKNQFDRDSNKYERITERNRINGAKGGRPKKNPETQTNPENLVTDTVTETETKKETKLLEQEFEIFWNIYNKKTDRKKCQQAWIKTMKDKKHVSSFIFEQARKYVEATPEAKYRKNPLTWINGECWHDEITNASQQKMTDFLNPKKYIPTR